DLSLRRQFISLAGELESQQQLPMHLAPIFAESNHPETLGPTLLHDLWTDGVILYGIAADLALLRPGELTPWEVIRFTAKLLTPAKRVDLSRRLYGRGGRPGVVVPPAVSLGPGVILLPPTDVGKVKDALVEFGATYDAFPVWRSI
ncbi:MAG TPA: hypothetical protein VFZ25_13805, partial [Chloroflexota bacterium]|nr:hypothetical protein [Chloroflexota bacterium]